MSEERTRRRERASSNASEDSSQDDRRKQRRLERERQRQKRNRLIKIVLIAVVAIVVIAVALKFILDKKDSSKADAPSTGGEQSEAVITPDEGSTPEATDETTPIDFTITFDLSEFEGATIEPASIGVPKDSEIPMLPYPKKDGLRFTGWSYTSPAGETLTIDNSNRELLQNGEDVTLYPKFEVKPTQVDEQTRGLPVLMYHYFYDSNVDAAPSDNNFFDIHDFEEEMKYLNENDYYYPNWDEVIEFINGNILLPEKSVVITTDDGHESVFRLMVPILEKYQVQATSFIVGIDFTPEFLVENHSEYLTFESHTYDMHRPSDIANGGRILGATSEEIAADVASSTELIGSHRVYCYPFGHINESAKAALRENGVQLGFTVVFGRDYPLMDPLELPRQRMSQGEPLSYFIARVE